MFGVGHMGRRDGRTKRGFVEMTWEAVRERHGFDPQLLQLLVVALVDEYVRVVL